MQEFFEKIIRSFSDFFKSLTIARRIALIAVSLFILAGIVGIIIWASKTRFKALYTDLNKEDSKQIAVLLEQNKISYRHF